MNGGFPKGGAQPMPRPRLLILLVLALAALVLAHWTAARIDHRVDRLPGDLPLDIEEIEAVLVASLLETSRVQLVDVRTEEEIGASSIPGAIWIPLGELRARVPDIAHFPELQADAPVVVYCRSGVRSISAVRSLRQAGFSYTYSLTGGIHAWERDGYPLYFGETP